MKVECFEMNLFRRTLEIPNNEVFQCMKNIKKYSLNKFEIGMIKNGSFLSFLPLDTSKDSNLKSCVDYR